MDTYDKNGRRRKCGPNWVPNWLFDEPTFLSCCQVHDIQWENHEGKFRSDIALLKCCWQTANKQVGWQRVRGKVQAVVMYFVLTTNPLSYFIYFINR